MPAHIKSSLLGAFLMLPIHQGALQLSWERGKAGEHRIDDGKRRIVATIQGEKIQ